MTLRSCARTCAVSEAAVSLPQMRTASGIIAIALMTWLLRAIESRCWFALACARFASAKGAAVARWFRSATAMRSSAVTMTIIPRSGWIRKIARMKRGAKGTSMNEISVPEVRKLRTVCRSPSVWYSRPVPWSEACAAAFRIGAPRREATSAAVRMRMWRRIASKTDWKTIAPTMIAVNMTSVSTERLVSTRSEIWNR